MEQKIARYLNWYYYGMLIVTLAAGGLLYALLTKGQLNPVDPQSEAGKLLQYIVVFDILFSAGEKAGEPHILFGDPEDTFCLDRPVDP